MRLIGKRWLATVGRRGVRVRLPRVRGAEARAETSADARGVDYDSFLNMGVEDVRDWRTLRPGIGPDGQQQQMPGQLMRAVWEEYSKAPDQWTVELLGRRFGLHPSRVEAILTLERNAEKLGGDDWHGYFLEYVTEATHAFQKLSFKLFGSRDLDDPSIRMKLEELASRVTERTEELALMNSLYDSDKRFLLGNMKDPNPTANYASLHGDDVAFNDEYDKLVLTEEDIDRLATLASEGHPDLEKERLLLVIEKYMPADLEEEHKKVVRENPARFISFFRERWINQREDADDLQFSSVISETKQEQIRRSIEILRHKRRQALAEHEPEKVFPKSVFTDDERRFLAAVEVFDALEQEVENVTGLEDALPMLETIAASDDFDENEINQLVKEGSATPEGGEECSNVESKSSSTANEHVADSSGELSVSKEAASTSDDENVDESTMFPEERDALLSVNKFLSIVRIHNQTIWFPAFNLAKQAHDLLVNPCEPFEDRELFVKSEHAVGRRPPVWDPAISTRGQPTPTTGSGSGELIAAPGIADLAKQKENRYLRHTPNRHNIVISDTSKWKKNRKIDITVRERDGSLRHATRGEWERALQQEHCAPRSERIRYVE